MEGLSGLLFLVIFFYVMMKFGCGSHGQNKSHQDKVETDHTDPVCGMTLKPEEGYGKMHKGHLTRFCSKACLEKFELDPNHYLPQETRS